MPFQLFYLQHHPELPGHQNSNLDRLLLAPQQLMKGGYSPFLPQPDDIIDQHEYILLRCPGHQLVHYLFCNQAALTHIQ
ncbi:hypothetical protein D3C71_1973360 [compost metagenome]